MVRFDITQGYFRDNPKYGRITNITEISTGTKLVLMGDLTKSEAMRQFDLQANRR